MENLLFEIIQSISLFIGVVGILTILIGALIGLYQFILPKHDIRMVRLVLGNHIILGLDFLVGKDIIDTLLIDGASAPEKFWMDLAGLFTVVIIRITLTYFTGKEIREIEMQTQKPKVRKS